MNCLLPPNAALAIFARASSSLCGLRLLAARRRASTNISLVTSAFGGASARASARTSLGWNITL
ncbi:MAG: hypothetical protein KF833_18495 [Verrucomicrobiae bacterium]|nr:hypothetical protein [Verrucomicrobiae bacterium]